MHHRIRKQGRGSNVEFPAVAGNGERNKIILKTMAAEPQNADPRALSADYETRKRAEIIEWLVAGQQITVFERALLVDNDNEPNGQIYARGSEGRFAEWEEAIGGWQVTPEQILAAYKKMELEHPSSFTDEPKEKKPSGPEPPPPTLS